VGTKTPIFVQKNFGEIPEGKCVRFRDGNNSNFEPKNLVLVGRFELLYLNQTKHNDLPEELKESNELVAKIESKIRE